MFGDQFPEFLDRLETRCLQQEFRYDHAHTSGDVTIWDNFATMHAAPPDLRIINDPANARLLYRINCKGDPSYSMPRGDSHEWIEANVEPPYRTPLVPSP